MSHQKRPIPTIKDVARRSGVSVGTVSHVLSGRTHVEADTAAKVQRAVEALGYRRNESARLLVGRKGGGAARTGNLGMIFLGVNQTWQGNPLISAILEGMQQAASQTGYQPVVEFVPDPAVLPRCLASGKVDGVVVRLAAGFSPWKELAKYPVPLVAIGGVAQGAICPVYLQDDAAAGAECAEALYALGHRRIAFLSTEAGHHAFMQRLAGFENQLRSRKCFASELVVAGESGDPRRDPEASPPDVIGPISKLLAQGATAVLACNDWAAAGMYRAAHALGRAIPDDFSLLAFDNTPGLCQALEPTLSSYELPVARMASDAVHRLAALIDAGGPSNPRETHMLGGRIVWRKSTAAPGGAQ